MTPRDADKPTLADYEEVLTDHRRLVRELDVAMHGQEGAALQTSLCDLIGPARRLREENERLRERMEYYADEIRYARVDRVMGRSGEFADCDVMLDEGKKARQALAENAYKHPGDRVIAEVDLHVSDGDKVSFDEAWEPKVTKAEKPK